MKTKLLLLASTSLLISACGNSGFVADTNQLLTANDKEQQYSNSLKGEFSLASSGTSVPGGTGGDPDEEVRPDLPPIDTECFPYPVYEVWMMNDVPGSGAPDQFLGSITAFRGTKSAVKNYHYRSSSAHPEVGPQPEPMTSTIFMYEDTAGANLTFFHNIDSDSEKIGSPSNKVSWKITTTGTGLRDRVLLSDDKLELREVIIPKVFPMDAQAMPMPPVQINNQKVYQAHWKYWYNTDGGIIGPFNNRGDMSIKIEMLSLGDIKDIQFASTSGAPLHIQNIGKKMTFVLKPKYSTAVVNSKSALAMDSTVWNDLCIKPEPTVTVKLNPVESVTLLSDLSTCSDTSGTKCMAPIHDAEWSVVGTQSFSIPSCDTKIEICPMSQSMNISRVDVRFSNQNGYCAEQAKLAMKLKKSLVIDGYGMTGFSSDVGPKTPIAQNFPQVVLSEIKACFVQE